MTDYEQYDFDDIERAISNQTARIDQIIQAQKELNAIGQMEILRWLKRISVLLALLFVAILGYAILN